MIQKFSCPLVPLLFATIFSLQVSAHAHFEHSCLGPAEELLRDQSPRIEKISDKIYMAIGYDLANSFMVVGEDGVIIIDTLGSVAAAQAVWNDFRPYAENKPVAAIVYTHFHADHSMGAKGFLGPDGKIPPIIAHAQFLPNMSDFIVTAMRTHIGSTYQFALGAEDAHDYLGGGIGPHLKFGPDQEPGYLPPTQLFAGKSKDFDIGGVEFSVYHLPGETSDQVGVYFPGEKALFAGDNFYQAFPSIYPIRGSKPRDAKAWARSVYFLTQFDADYLLPSHLEPVVGKETIRETLTNYARAIEYLHDQTLRLARSKKPLEDIVDELRLPDELANLPYLKEQYGLREHAVRGIYTFYFGHFDLKEENYFLSPSREHAENIQRLAGGERGLRDSIAHELAGGQLMWAMGLMKNWQLLNCKREAEHCETMKKLYAKTLADIARQQANHPARNFFLVKSKIATGELDHPKIPNKKSYIDILTVPQMLELLKYRVNPLKAGDKDIRLGITIKGGRDYNFECHLVDSVLRVSEVKEFAQETRLIVTTSEETWRKLYKEKPSAAEFMTRYLLTGRFGFSRRWGLLSFARFMRSFDRD